MPSTTRNATTRKTQPHSNDRNHGTFPQKAKQTPRSRRQSTRSRTKLREWATPGGTGRAASRWRPGCPAGAWGGYRGGAAEGWPGWSGVAGPGRGRLLRARLKGWPGWWSGRAWPWAVARGGAAGGVVWLVWVGWAWLWVVARGGGSGWSGVAGLGRRWLLRARLKGWPGWWSGRAWPWVVARGCAAGGVVWLVWGGWAWPWVVARGGVAGGSGWSGVVGGVAPWRRCGCEPVSPPSRWVGGVASLGRRASGPNPGQASAFAGTTCHQPFSPVPIRRCDPTVDPCHLDV